MSALRAAYLVRVFDATSQLLNVLLLNGSENESISGRAFREDWKVTVRVIDTLLFWDKDHCASAHFNDVLRASFFIEQENLRSK